jgi:acyl carrier protein
MDRMKLEAEIKILIIDALEMDEVSPGDISTDDPLFGEGWGLDSIDGQEIGIALEKKYGVAIDDEQKKYFYSVSTLADLVLEHRNKLGEIKCLANTR